MRGRPTKDLTLDRPSTPFNGSTWREAGRYLRTGKKARRTSGQMRHVEAVIKMLVPACNLARITVKRRQRGTF